MLYFRRMANLFLPVTIKDITLKNRIVVSPMCQYSSVDGFANNWHLVHLGSFATHGSALIITEATAVSPEGRISYGDLGLWKDEHKEKLKEIVDFVHQHDALIGTQLAHAGRKASHHKPWHGNKQILPNEANGWQTVAPSAIAFAEGEEAPQALDKVGINKIIADFKAAAKRAYEVGFDVIELHGAHGYLINQFLSPLSNKREDEYGGSFENRIRLLLEIIDAVREVWPPTKPLFVRISATDWVEEGWTIEDSVALAKILKTKGVDVMDCSSGGSLATARYALGPGYQVPFAEQVKHGADILTGAVGMITEPAQAEEIITSGKADLVFLARQLLREPSFPLRAAHELGIEVKWAVQYERAKWKK